MPRKSVESYRIQARVSLNNCSEEDVIFVREKLREMGETPFIHKAIRYYRLVTEGKMISLQSLKEILKEGDIKKISVFNDSDIEKVIAPQHEEEKKKYIDEDSFEDENDDELDDLDNMINSFTNK